MTEPGLADIDRVKLIKLLALTSSTFDGEVLNAARLANRLVQERGMTWSEVIAPRLPPPQAQDPRTRPVRARRKRKARQTVPDPKPLDSLADWPLHWRHAITLCVEVIGALGTWHAEFIRSLASYKNSPSEKQLAILRDITERALALKAAAKS